MSGGAFDYKQYQIYEIVDQIEHRLDPEYDDDDSTSNYTKETLAQFQEGVKALKRASIFAQRIDWLLSGDDGETAFHRRLKEELEGLEDK
ncbi:hypothetical protein KAR91_50370 [Candidatus Pacearchaeota archaeon]|nr:hypothetical protein [Candidatus Pacearchaeota archaeon]